MPIVDSSPSPLSVLPTPPPRFQALDANGNPLVGGQLFTYEAGSTAPLATFDGSGAANTNPVILDANGSADVRLGPGAYKFVLEDANGVQLWSADNIPGADYAIVANPSAPQTISAQPLLVEEGVQAPIGRDGSEQDGTFTDITVTSSDSKQRVVNTTNLGQAFSANLQADGVTRDVNGRWGMALAMDTVNGGFKARIVSPGGTVKDYAPRLTAGADFTAHENTGNIARNTLISRTIVGNTLGPSGGVRIRCYIHAVTQGATPTTVAVYMNGNQAVTMSIANIGFYVWEVVIGNRGTGAQVVYGIPQFYGPVAPALLPISAGVAAQDTTQDQQIDIRVQNGQNTDDIFIDIYEMYCITTFAS